MSLEPDGRDLPSAFAGAGGRCLLVGGYAVSFYGRPRFPRGVDLGLAPGGANAAGGAPS